MMLHTKYQGSKLYGFRKDFFMFFPTEAYVKHVTPGKSHFSTQGINMNKVGQGSLSDALYQIARL